MGIADQHCTATHDYQNHQNHESQKHQRKEQLHHAKNHICQIPKLGQRKIAV
jgi:hypothetical protein